MFIDIPQLDLLSAEEKDREIERVLREILHKVERESASLRKKIEKEMKHSGNEQEGNGAA